MCPIQTVIKSKPPLQFSQLSRLPWLDTLATLMTFMFNIFVLSAAIFLSGVLAQTENGTGTIHLPENGTHVLPGQWVPFYYESMGDYSVTSYNFTVWLYTSDPREGLFTGAANGISIGTWSYSSSTNTNPSHAPPPPQIYIPDFSKGVGGFPSGFAVGMNASDATLWLSVFEEYGTGSCFGAKIAYTSNQLLYNSTQVDSPAPTAPST